MRKLTVFLLFAGVLCIPFAEAMPTEAEIQEVRPILQQLTEDDYAALKAGKKTRSELADSLLGYVSDAESEAAKFSLIQMAFKNYMEVYEPEKAIMAFDSLDSNVKDVPRGTFGDWCSPHVAKFAKNGRADALAVLLNKSLDSGDAKSTSALMTALKPYMRKLGAGAKAPATPFAAAVDRATRQERRARELATLKAAVKKSPSDASAHEKYALALSATGDWAAALKEFALASGSVAEAAAWETKWPNAGESSWTPAKAAELWWDRADTAKDEDAATVLRGRSVAWYKIAIDKGELTGLRKTIAEKRIREAEQSGVAAATIAAAPVVANNEPSPRRRSRRQPETAVAPTPPPAAPAPEVTPVKIKGGPWTLPKTFQTPLERSLDLGNGVSMPFCACPAGSFRMMDHKVTITRPYWISKTVVSLDQLMTSPGVKNLITRYSPDKMMLIEKVMKQFSDRFSCISMPIEGPFRYLDELNKKYRGVLPPKYIFRLPTEAELYYAYCAGMDETSATPTKEDDADTTTGEAFSELGWIPKVAVWRWNSFPHGYSSVRLATLPETNSYGVVPWVYHSGCFWILDTIKFDMEGNRASTKQRGGSDLRMVMGMDRIKEIMNYSDEEIDPLRIGNNYVEVAGRVPRQHDIIRVVKDHAARFMVVIGPDLESEKKAGKR